MSRTSSIGRLQMGQDPRLINISREQTLQNVCPQGIKAAPLLLSMHTQHTQSISPPVPFPFPFPFPRLLLLWSLSFFLLLLQSRPSVSSINVISDFTCPATLLGPTTSSLPPPAARELRSAANAIARFMPAGTDPTTTETGSSSS
uniref:Uncharacterized protein n=1 Tax=Cannabis sativa TaxID=3483 RepID=A0A803RAY6_CANSA